MRPQPIAELVRSRGQAATMRVLRFYCHGQACAAREVFVIYKDDGRSANQIPRCPLCGTQELLELSCHPDVSRVASFR